MEGKLELRRRELLYLVLVLSLAGNAIHDAAAGDIFLLSYVMHSGKGFEVIPTLLVTRVP